MKVTNGLRFLAYGPKALVYYMIVGLRESLLKRKCLPLPGFVDHTIKNQPAGDIIESHRQVGNKKKRVHALT